MQTYQKLCLGKVCIAKAINVFISYSRKLTALLQGRPPCNIFSFLHYMWANTETLPLNVDGDHLHSNPDIFKKSKRSW